MDAARIVDQLTRYDRLPEHALRAASAERHLLVPEFIELLERFADGGLKEDGEGLLLIFHLLGEWHETAAYRPLLRLLRRSSDELDMALGDAVTMTGHRVIASVFDGDSAPLYDLILDPSADEFVRSGMCEVIPMVAVRGLLPRLEAARFLDEAAARLEGESGCFVWSGWQSAVAMLGLADLAPRVKDAFERGVIDRSWLAYGDFEEDLAYALAHPDAPHKNWDSEYSPFADTIGELSKWYGFSEQYFADRRRYERQELRARRPRLIVHPAAPLINPARAVGRNDPCPCGSGLKDKRCCLNAARAS